MDKDRVGLSELLQQNGINGIELDSFDDLDDIDLNDEDIEEISEQNNEEENNEVSVNNDEESNDIENVILKLDSTTIKMTRANAQSLLTKIKLVIKQNFKPWCR